MEAIIFLQRHLGLVLSYGFHVERGLISVGYDDIDLGKNSDSIHTSGTWKRTSNSVDIRTQDWSVRAANPDCWGCRWVCRQLSGSQFLRLFCKPWGFAYKTWISYEQCVLRPSQSSSPHA